MIKVLFMQFGSTLSKIKTKIIALISEKITAKYLKTELGELSRNYKYLKIYRNYLEKNFRN